MEWNEPLYVEAPGIRGRVGVLVIHGFGGSPRSLEELAMRCADAGYSVALPLLTGHGLTPEAMESSRWTDWTADVERAYEWLQARTDKVFVCGLSMGGTLALWLVAHHPDAAGLVSINTLTRHPLEWAMHVLGRVGRPRWMNAIGNDTKAEGIDEKAYPKLPARAFRQLALLLAEVRPLVPRIHCPALLFSSSVDHRVPPANQRELFGAIASVDKTFVELDDSYHLATMDNDKERVFSQTLEFVCSHSNLGDGRAAGLDQ